MVTPVHRFQTIESATLTQQLRRPHQQSSSQPRAANQFQTSVVGSEVQNESAVVGPTSQPEPDAPIYLGDPSPEGGGLDTVPHAQLMRLGGLTKYGMWASFGLTTISVAATKFYVDHQGTFEILLLWTLGVLSAGLLVSCILTVCKRNPPPEFVNVPPQLCQPTAVEVDLQEVTSHRDIIIAPIGGIVSHQSTTTTTVTEPRPGPEMEAPPPPYDIAILLPVGDHASADFPPPTYESAIESR